jgi:hypothetical protein
MTRPTRRADASTFQFKKRTPKVLLSARKGERITLQLPDLQGGYTKVPATVGEVIKVSLRTREPDLAKLRCAAIGSQLERLANTAAAGTQRLTQRQVRALAGEAHAGRKCQRRVYTLADIGADEPSMDAAHEYDERFIPEMEVGPPRIGGAEAGGEHVR